MKIGEYDMKTQMKKSIIHFKASLLVGILLIGILPNIAIADEGYCYLNIEIDPNDAAGVVTGSGWNQIGEYATITAVANEGYVFGYWNGHEPGHGIENVFVSETRVLMDKDKTITAMYNSVDDADLFLNTLVDPPGAGTVNGGGWYHGEQHATITAIANEGYIFSHWQGNMPGPCIDDVFSPETEIFIGEFYKTVTAVFASINDLHLHLSVCAEPRDAGVVTGTGWYYETQHAIITATANPGYEFSHWDGTHIENIYSPETDIFIDESMETVTAVFVQQTMYELTVETEGCGSICRPEGPFSPGSIVLIYATSCEGWQFVGWSGDVPDADMPITDNPLTIVMDRDKTITAHFEHDPDPTYYDIYIGDYNNEAGSVQLTPQGPYTPGTIVVVTAIPNEGYVFGGWMGDIPEPENPATLIMTSDKYITPIFLYKVPNNEVIAYYQMNEGYGTTIHDSSGNNLHGITVNPEWTNGAGLSGSALSFNKQENRYVIIEDSLLLDLQTFEISADFKPASDINTWPRGYQTLVSKEYQYILRFFSNYTDGRVGLSAIYFHGQSFFSHISVTVFLDTLDPEMMPEVGEWSTIKMSYDGTSLQLYLNGVLIREKYAPANEYPPHYSDVDLLIGNHQSGGYSAPWSSIDEFIGDIDNVLIKGIRAIHPLPDEPENNESDETSIPNENDESDTSEEYEVYYCGDINNDGSIGIHDVICIVEYMFQGGALPDPICIANVDGQAGVTISDLVYLVAYIFHNGQGPIISCS